MKFTLTNINAYDMMQITLCTAYKSTVQTEQTVTERHGVGAHGVTVVFFIHGTVVANTDSWVFFLLSRIFSAIELS